MDRRLTPQSLSFNPFRSSKRSGSEYVYADPRTQGRGCGLGTAGAGLLGLGLGAAGGYAGASMAGSNSRSGQGRSTRSAKPAAADRYQTESYDEASREYYQQERARSNRQEPRRERSRERRSDRRNDEGTNDRPRGTGTTSSYARPSRSSRPGNSESRRGRQPAISSSQPPPAYEQSAGPTLGRDAVINPASLPPASSSKTTSHKDSSKASKSSKPKTSGSRSHPQGLPVVEPYLGGGSTRYYDQGYEPRSGMTGVQSGYMGPAQTMPTVGMVGEGMRLEKTGSRMARFRARLCGGVPAA